MYAYAEEMSTQPRTPKDPQDVLGYLLKHAASRLAALTDAALEQYGIDSKELGVLRMLAYREPTSQLQLAQALDIDRTTMVALLDELERKGVLARRPDHSDRRRNVTELTERGLQIYDAAELEHQAAEAAFLSQTEPDAADQLRRALRALIEP